MQLQTEAAGHRGHWRWGDSMLRCAAHHVRLLTAWPSTDLLQLGVEAVHMQVLQVSILQGHKHRGW